MRSVALGISGLLLTSLAYGTSAQAPSAECKFGCDDARTLPVPAYGTVAHLFRLERNDEGRKSAYSLMRNAGLELVRFDVLASRLRSESGALDFRRYDRILGELSAEGLTMLPIIYGYDAAMSKPKDMAKYSEYVQAIVSHLGRRCPVVEIWCEPNVERFFAGTDPRDYVETLKTAYRAVKSVDPSVRVAFGGLSHVPLDYIRAALVAGAGECFDIMNVHPYSHPLKPEGSVDTELEALKALMAEFGVGDRPIWVTELGYPTHANALHFRDVLLCGLRIARPNQPVWRVIIADLSEKGEIANQSLATSLLPWLPDGSTAVVCSQAETCRKLDGDEADLVIYPQTEFFPADTLPAVRRFVERGGILADFGGAPLWFGRRGDRRVRELENGIAVTNFPFRCHAWWSKDAVYPKRLSLAPTGLASSFGVGVPAGGFTTKIFLSPDSRIGEKDWIPLLSGRCEDGRELVGAAVLRCPNGGALILNTARPRGNVTPQTECEQAKYMARGMAICMAEGVETFVNYELWGSEADLTYSEDHFGLLHAGLEPKPAYSACAAFVRMRPCGSRQKTGAWHDDGRTFYYPRWVRPDGREGGVLWTAGERRSVTVRYEKGKPQFFSQYGLRVEFPEIGPGRFRLLLTDEPVYYLGGELEEVLP